MSSLGWKESPDYLSFQLTSIQKFLSWSPHHWDSLMKPRRPSLPSHIDGISSSETCYVIGFPSVISCQWQIEVFLKISREPLAGACIGYKLDFKVFEYLTLHEQTLVSKHLLIMSSPFKKKQPQLPKKILQ